MNKAVRTSLWLLAIALVVPVLLFGAYFLHGSLEQFPTEEQQGKVRIVSGLGFILFALLEAIVIVALLRGSKSTIDNRRVSAAQPPVPAERPKAGAR